jgi:hypothetical protein
MNFELSKDKERSRLDLSPEDTLQDTLLSEVHRETSQAVEPTLTRIEKSEVPKLDAVTRSTADPVVGRAPLEWDVIVGLEYDIDKKLAATKRDKLTVTEKELPTPAETLQMIDVSANQWDEGHAVLPSLTDTDASVPAKLAPNRVKTPLPVAATKGMWEAVTIGELYEKKRALVEDSKPALITTGLLPPLPDAGFAAAEESDVQEVCSAEVPPTRTRTLRSKIPNPAPKTVMAAEGSVGKQ